MSRKPPFVAIITLVCFVATQLFGCGTSLTRKYSEDGVNVIVANTGKEIHADSGHVVVLGRIRIQDKQGTSLNANTELAIYTLRDVAPDALIPDWPLAELVRLDTKPFAPDKDGYLRIVLPKGRYYFQLVYRHPGVGLLTINPRVRIDVSNESQVVYLGTLTVTIDLERVGEPDVAGTTSHPSNDGVLSISVSNEFTQDSQQLLANIQNYSDLSIVQKMFVIDPRKEPNLLASKNRKAGVFNENLSTGEIIIYSAALLVLIPLWVVLAALPLLDSKVFWPPLFYANSGYAVAWRSVVAKHQESAQVSCDAVSDCSEGRLLRYSYLHLYLHLNVLQDVQLCI